MVLVKLEANHIKNVELQQLSRVGQARETCDAKRRLDFRRSFVSSVSLPSGEERGLLSRTAADDRAYAKRGNE